MTSVLTLPNCLVQGVIQRHDQQPTLTKIGDFKRTFNICILLHFSLSTLQKKDLFVEELKHLLIDPDGLQKVAFKTHPLPKGISNSLDYEKII